MNSILNQSIRSETSDETVFTEDYYNNIDLRKWVKVRVGGDTNYTPRTGHECISYKNKIYLFGGTDDDERRNDLYQYDIYKN